MAVATRRQPKIEYIAPYDATKIAWHRPALLDKSFILLATGSAGGGKSRFAAEKLHMFCMYYPGAQALALRKTRESMTNSTVLFLVTKVIGNDPNVVHKESKHRFEYANGSYLSYGGMKDKEQREQVRSIGADAGVDIAWMEEATEFEEADFQELIPRMRGKAAPWRQIIPTTNPDGPLHWINQRLIIGHEASVYYSSAKDNPFNPPDYLENLQRLTGIQKLRLVDGLWVQAEGIIYDNFTLEKNVADVAYDPNQPVLWGVDDGYAAGEGIGTASYHPRVVLIGQEDGRGGFNILHEYYKTGEARYEDTIDNVLTLGYPPPMLAFVDSSAAMFRGALTQKNLPNQGATHNVTEGIRNVRRLISDGNAVTLLHIHPRCTQLISELQMYAYDDTAQVQGDRKPAKLNDHGPDALRYMTWHARWNP